MDHSHARILRRFGDVSRPFDVDRALQFEAAPTKMYTSSVVNDAIHPGGGSVNGFSVTHVSRSQIDRQSGQRLVTGVADKGANLFAPLKEQSHNVVSDEPGGACDQIQHAEVPIRERRIGNGPD